MKFALKSVLLFGLLTLMSAAMLAQSGVVTMQTGGFVVPGGSTGSALRFGPSAITGSPYCATQETETAQTLIDGTHISHKSKMQMCRDSQGRTRQEIFAGNLRGEALERPTMIQISDPVEGVRHSLDVNRHVARRTGMAQLARPPMPLPSGPNVSLPSSPPRNPSTQFAPETKTEPLDSQVIEGVFCEGTRIMTVFPAGFMGNDRPITTTEERWHSQELGMIVLSKRSDPRSGETVQRLTNIDRSEPDPALFRVPADYTIEDMPNPLGPR